MGSASRTGGFNDPPRHPTPSFEREARRRRPADDDDILSQALNNSGGAQSMSRDRSVPIGGMGNLDYENKSAYEDEIDRLSNQSYSEHGFRAGN